MANERIEITIDIYPPGATVTARIGETTIEVDNTADKWLEALTTVVQEEVFRQCGMGGRSRERQQRLFWRTMKRHKTMKSYFSVRRKLTRAALRDALKSGAPAPDITNETEVD